MTTPREVKDFAILFSYFWYRDFPVHINYREYGGRADWTIHIGVTMRACADLMGYFTAFEKGIRTDAIMTNNAKEMIAQAEWEWNPLHRRGVNEIEKLLSRESEFQFSIFFNYTNERKFEEILNIFKIKWEKAKRPLLLFLVTYSKDGRNRIFKDMYVYLFYKGKKRLLRKQPALPWEANGRRWECINGS